MPIIKTAPFIDIHVHFRQPGQEHKETIATGCAAALAGGFGAVAAMPNTTPVIDSPELVRYVLEKSAGLPVRVYPVAAVTLGQNGGELTDFAALGAAGAAALSDDGRPVMSEEIMRRALIAAHAAGMPLFDHCEPETEQAERDAFLATKTGCPVHICHVSRADTVTVLRAAKRRGAPITAETAPHYMTALASGKMNPPLGTQRDVDAVLDALCDGVITVIATDHAPHTAAEKESDNPPNGVIGLETALAAVLEALYHSGRMELSRIFDLMRTNPARILGVPEPDGVIMIDTDAEWAVTPESFRSMARNTPFDGLILRGKIVG